MLIAGVLGMAIGLVLGLTGAGGGIFAVPALVFGLGMRMQEAAPVALLAVGIAAGVGAAQGLRQGIVRYKAALVLAMAGTLTAPWGVALAQRLPERGVALLFALVMLLVAYRMFRASLTATKVECESQKICRISTQTGRFVWTFRTALILSMVGLVSGLLTGMLGVGGGFIIVPALLYFSDLRMHSVVATSLLVIALLSTVTVALALSRGLTLEADAWWFVAMAIAGMVVGRWLAPRLASTLMQRGFAVSCVAVAGLMLWRIAIF